MGTLVSEGGRPDEDLAKEKVPLAGPKRDAAIKALETPGFLERLTVQIMKQAARKGFFNLFDDNDMDLPGGKSAADLAVDIVEKALDGSYSWNDETFPDFYHFCRSRAESILSNWLSKCRPVTAMSPKLEDVDGGVLGANPVNSATDPEDIYHVLRNRDGGALGDRFLADLALDLPDGSPEQAIALAVHDDRECFERAYCRGKLGLAEQDYDAAVKRLRRRAPKFLEVWCQRNGINREDVREVR